MRPGQQTSRQEKRGHVPQLSAENQARPRKRSRGCPGSQREMEDLLEGLLELAIQEATIKARDVVRLRGGDKAAYVAKAKEAAEKVCALALLDLWISPYHLRLKSSARC